MHKILKNSDRLVEIKVWVKVFNKNTNKEQEDEIWLPGEMVEGGKYKLMRFIKSKTQELKLKIKDSPKTVLDMKLVELVIENVPESITLFEHIKLFGGGLDYMHYNSKSGKSTGCCVPDYVVATRNNKEEKDRTSRLKQLTSETVLIALEMKTSREGCTLLQ